MDKRSVAASVEVVMARREREVRRLCRVMRRAVKQNNLVQARRYSEQIRRLRDLNAKKSPNFAGRNGAIVDIQPTNTVFGLFV